MDEQWEAGVELDRLIAERVFGVQTKIPSTVGHRSGKIVFAVSHIAVPHYSTDIAAAWEIVEHFRCGGMTCILETSRIYPGDRAAFSVLDSLEAETMPLAICMAALKVVEATNG